MFWAALLLFSGNAVAERHDSDLMSFVTLPEVRALKWEVEHYDRERLAPGYWFVAPYGKISPDQPTLKYQQYQVGPYIYDDNGVLIWAGAPLYDNHNVFDFKPVYNIDNDPYLSFIVGWEYDDSKKGHGAIVNSHYEVEKEVQALSDVHDFNMHEFNIMDGGKTALACTYRSQPINLADFGRPTEESWVTVGGFVEVDVQSSEVLVQWDSLENIALHESNMFHASDAPAGSPGWDYVHINAVDKNGAGDYLISMRFTNTIYLISGRDGNIAWRLGGTESDFEQDFVFSKQHDVKFVSSNGTHHVISFLNNASDERGNDEKISSVLFVELDTGVVPMTAKVIKRINRPDSGLTRLRGSAQALPNGNVFIGWSERGYSSEHASNGELLMTAQFSSDRYSTYRSYKGEFTGRPTAPPDLVASVYGTRDEDMTTIIHVSWNGATDVVQWKFYAKAYDHGDSVLIGTIKKTDFETMFIADGFMDFVSAEAIDAEGNVMHTSEIMRTGTPPDWKAAGWAGSGSGPSPDDPSIIVAANDNADSTSSADSTNGEAAEVINDSSSTGSGNRSGAQYADAKEVAKAVYKAYDVIRGVSALLIFIILTGTLGGAGFALWRYLHARRISRYQHVPSEDRLPVEEIRLASNQRP
ncbi:unnamed protein product [Penicillium nalgiovense]|uniref:ASST-domain-containing protein n=1 Tax=Penicillium nalgiovense TaxID=60175 RepID=A0A9W4N9Q3_PENNA|nr:unnamed protein product [Penicillium nalgiovense]CAG7964022.1 unnamed protein product [Penicillium nalgiovense]CAG7989285.1 unnamed protein product [Penicillium nalgiovense]CAG8047292.1 unnamed protein product [Penicillium nalgiovense]CAG8051410.1 unnamed protein product [Penicillium nalgiovense]